ncbi:MAG: hypothetical protein JWQ71_565 [Pedosphaera sp.]|nr:hypothetical protein [Pedosphaera sp.]
MQGGWVEFKLWLSNCYGSNWKTIPMLAKLPEVNWGRLVHAYGAADDVPGLIRGLASSRPKWRRKAMQELYVNIWHQGTVYEATGYAVPFLIGLLEAEVVQDKPEILMLLSEIARGNSYHEVHQHGFLKEQAQTPEWQGAIRKELVWVRAAKEAVLAGKPIYLKLLAHPEMKVRESAPYLLACLPRESVGMADELWKRLHEEREPQVRASLILAIGVITTDRNLAEQQFEQLLLDERDPVVRLAVAMSLMRLTGGKMREDVVVILLEAIANPELVSKEFGKSPWADAGNIEAQVSEYLSLLTGEAAGRAVPLLAKALASADAYSALSITSAMLSLAFERKPMPKDTRVNELSERQRLVLASILQSDTAWICNGNMSDILRGYGVPSWRNKLEIFLKTEDGDRSSFHSSGTPT